MMKILKNAIPLHKLYGFLLLNTSLIAFTPAVLATISKAKYSNSIPFELGLTLALSLCGVILSILFIMRKRIAIYCLTFLLVATIVIMAGYMCYMLYGMTYLIVDAALLIINAFGFFIVEGILGLLIIHSKKLSDEFQQYN